MISDNDSVRNLSNGNQNQGLKTDGYYLDDYEQDSSKQHSSEDTNDSFDNYSRETFFDLLIDNLLPDDYEQNKHETYKNVKNINETIEFVKRLHGLGEKWVKFFQPLQKRLSKEMYDLILEAEVSPECVNGMNRVFQGFCNNQLWAIKCKLN